MELYKRIKHPEILSLLSVQIEKFYNNLILYREKNSNYLMLNKYKIINQINLMKKYNLDEKNKFLLIDSILKNETG